MQAERERIYQLHADYCRSLANPTRLMVLDCLRDGELSVSDIAKRVEAPLSTVSKHLSSLRERSIVDRRKSRQTVYYHLADRRVLDACAVIRSVLVDNMRARGEIARELDIAEPVLRPPFAKQAPAPTQATVNTTDKGPQQ